MNMRKWFLRFALVFSILAGAIPILCHEWLFDKGEVHVTLPESWKRMSTQERLDNLDGLLSKNEAFFLLSRIKQLRIRSQLRKMIVCKEDQVLRHGATYSLSFRYDIGWAESGLLGLAGFTSIWIIYGCTKMVILFVRSLPTVRFPSPELGGWKEPFRFPTWREPAGLASVRITLFGFLTLDERPKRPKKPGAVWID
jgi:hypothetical protein